MVQSRRRRAIAEGWLEDDDDFGNNNNDTFASPLRPFVPSALTNSITNVSGGAHRLHEMVGEAAAAASFPSLCSQTEQERDNSRKSMIDAIDLVLNHPKLSKADAEALQEKVIATTDDLARDLNGRHRASAGLSKSKDSGKDDSDLNVARHTSGSDCGDSESDSECILPFSRLVWGSVKGRKSGPKQKRKKGVAG